MLPGLVQEQAQVQRARRPPTKCMTLTIPSSMLASPSLPPNQQTDVQLLKMIIIIMWRYLPNAGPNLDSIESTWNRRSKVVLCTSHSQWRLHNTTPLLPDSKDSTTTHFTNTHKLKSLPTTTDSQQKNSLCSSLEYYQPFSFDTCFHHILRSKPF